MMKLLALLGLSLLLFSVPAFAQADVDGDGVEDSVDACPAEDASYYDADGDGCLDPTRNTRNVEYWSLADLPLTYVIHQNGAPNITDGSDFTAIQAGFDAWPAIPGVTLSASYAGTTAEADADGLDGINHVTFEDSTFLAVYGSSVLAVGITTSFTEPTNFNGADVRPGQIVDADMIFNPLRVFSTDTAASGPDLTSVAVHEAGHLYGFSHSAVVTSTMFPALPVGTNGRTLEVEDQVLAFMGYPDGAALASATSISGTVTEGATALPLGGAAVFAISVATDDTLGSQFTFEDGTYQFVGLPAGDYYVGISPMDGSRTNGVVSGYINDYVEGIATNTLWNPEYWDLAESATDNDADRDAITAAEGAQVTGIDIETNTDLSAPQLVTVEPEGLTDVRADAVFFVAFDEDIDFDSAAAHVQLNKIEAAGTSPIGFALLQVTSDNVIIVDPAGLMDYSTDYELVLQAGLADRFGNGIPADITTAFTVEAAPPLTISTMSPENISAGTVAVIYGQGFDLTSAGNNTVDFGGIPAAASTVNPNALSVEVPAGLADGPISLTVSTVIETSNTIAVVAVTSNDFIKGTEFQTVALDGDVGKVELLPDAAYGYITSSTGMNWISSGFANPDLGTTGLVPYVGGFDDLAMAPDGNRVYAVSRTGQELVVINSDYGDVVSPNPTFNTVLDQLPVGAEPLGVAVDPAGERAYVVLDGGDVQIWDIELGSATYHRQVGLLESPYVSAQGAIAVDRTGLRVLSLSGSGDVLVWDASSLLDPPAEASIGGDLRDIAIDPKGTVAYVTDANGSVHVLLLATTSISQVISTGGNPRSMTLTPSGNRGYVADRANNSLPGIDLELGSPTFRTVTGDLSVGNQPVDVAVSPDAAYQLVVEQGSNEVQILGIGQGPEVYRITPAWARPGDMVTIQGAGFAVAHPTLGNSSQTRVYFGDTMVVPVFASTTSCWVKVPATFTGGQVKVGNIGAVLIGFPDELFSNPVSLRILDSQDSKNTDYGRSVFLGAGDPAYPWDSSTSAVRAVATSPTGKFMLGASNDNRVHMIDIDPSSLNLGQVIGSIQLTGVVKKGSLVIGNDGKLAYAGVGDEIHILDTDPDSPTFLTDIGTTLWQNSNQGSQGFPDIMRITPSGEMLVVTDELNDQMFFVDINPASQSYHQMITETGPIGYALGMQIHPSGLAAYMVASTGLLHMIDLDPLSAGYLTQANTFAFAGSPEDLAFSPDGDFCYFLQIQGPGEVGIEQLALTIPTLFLPTSVGGATNISAGAGPSDRVSLYMSPSGDRMIADIPGTGISILLRPRPGDPTLAVDSLGALNFNGTNSEVHGAWNPDMTGLWSVSLGDSGIQYIDLAVSFKMAPVSGTGQTGVAGQPLATPLTYFVDDGAGNAAVGAVAEVEIAGGGGTLGNGGTYQWLVVDENGLLEVDWTMGPIPDPTANKVNITFNDRSVRADGITIATVADPGTLPLSQSGVLPVDTAMGVSLTSTAQVTFSRAVNVAMVAGANIGLRYQSDGTAVPVAYGFADGNSRVSMIPLSVLPADTTFEVYTTAGLTDADGNALTNPTVATFATQAPPPLAISAVSPPAATVGTQVVISGTGFAAAAADNTVRFGAASSPATTAGPGYIIAYVPLGATTGNLTVEVNAQSSGALPFTVLIPETSPLDEIISTVDTGISIQSVAVTPDGSKAYTVSTETNEVLPVDLDTFTNLPAITVGSGPQGVVIHPDGTTAYVTNFGSGTVSVIDVSTDAVVATVNVGANPVELVASPIGDRLYVVNTLDQTLSVIDIDVTSATYHTVVSSYSTGKSTKGAAVSPDGTVLYLGTSDGYIAVEVGASASGVVTSYSTGKSTKGAAITPDGSLLLLVTTSNEVLIVDVSEGGSNAVVSSYSTGKSTKGAAITPDGSLLYILQEGSDEILVIELIIGSSVSSSVISGPVVVTATLLKTIEVDPDPGVIAFDPSGSGLAIIGHQRSSGQLTFLNVSSIPFGQLDAAVEVHPRTLNLGSRGRFVTGYVELPAGFYVENIDLATLKLNDMIPPELDKVEFVDRDQDTVNELVLKFDRKAAQESLPQGDYVPVWINGLMTDGRSFAGYDTIRTIRPQVTHPAGNEAFYPTQQIMITWASPEGVTADCVDVYWSADDGASWTAIAIGIEDSGAIPWTVPDQYTDRALVEVSLFDNCDGSHEHGDTPIGVGMSQDTFFIVDQAVPVVMQAVDLAIHDGAGRIEWSIADPYAVEGFHVLRSDREDGEFQRVSSSVVTAVSTPDGMKFVFEDDSIFANRDYYYVLEENRERGAGFDHGPYRLNWRLQNALFQNTPNTFNPRTSISFSTAQDGRARLAVYNVAGRLVDVIVDEFLRADTHEYTWEGKDRQGQSVASGVYIYRLSAPGGFIAARKMTLVR